MADKMRVTMHNGRAGKYGAYSPHHNDRDIHERDDHIDKERTPLNWVWHCEQRNHPDMTLDEMEQKFYKDHFAAAIIDRNERALKARHPERIIDIDAYRASQKTCPEETIMQIGHKDLHTDPEVLKKICIEQIKWEQKTYPQCKLLSVALHVDEQGAPHLHKRQVWISHDKAGREVVGQEKALEEMGVKLPHPDKPVGRHNNRKQTHTAACREHFQEICKSHGIAIETTPQEPSRTGLSLLEYQVRQEQEKADLAWMQADQAHQLEADYRLSIMELSTQEAQKEAQSAELDKSIAERQKALTEASERLQNLEGKLEELSTLDERIQQRYEILERSARIKEPSKLEKLIFKQDDTVTYDRGTVEELCRDIRNIKSALSDLDCRKSELDRREAEVSRKERDWEPEWQRITETRSLLEERERRINVEVDKRAQQKLDDVLKREFSSQRGGRLSRLEKFIGEYQIGDKSLLAIFEAEEEKLKHRLSHSLNR